MKRFNNLNQQILDVPPGPAGTNGTNGTNGQGVPPGGTAGQVLEKTDETDYNTQWASSVAAQTPWASNIDGFGFDLTNVGLVSASNGEFSGGIGGASANVTGDYAVNGTVVVSAQQPAIADSDLTEADNGRAINEVLAALRTHGLIAAE